MAASGATPGTPAAHAGVCVFCVCVCVRMVVYVRVCACVFVYESVRACMCVIMCVCVHARVCEDVYVLMLFAFKINHDVT